MTGPRIEVVPVRLTKAERARLNAMGGFTTAINWVQWNDGTMGQTWPAIA